MLRGGGGGGVYFVGSGLFFGLFWHEITLLIVLFTQVLAFFFNKMVFSIRSKFLFYFPLFSYVFIVDLLRRVFIR